MTGRIPNTAANYKSGAWVFKPARVNWRKIAISLIEAEKGEIKAQACDKAWFQQLTVRLAQGRSMKIAELKGLPNWQATAVDNQTGHAIAIVRAGNDGYHVIRGEVRRGAFNLLRSVGGLGADYCEVGQC